MTSSSSISSEAASREVSLGGCQRTKGSDVHRLMVEHGVLDERARRKVDERNHTHPMDTDRWRYDQNEDDRWLAAVIDTIDSTSRSTGYDM